MNNREDYIYKEIENVDYILQASDYFWEGNSWTKIYTGGGIAGYTIKQMRRNYAHLQKYAKREIAAPLFPGEKRKFPYGY